MERASLCKETVLSLYARMQRCRQFEECLHRAVNRGELPGFVHLYAGEEAVAAGVCENLRLDDWIVSTHRGHGHLLAKGMDMKRIMAELYGRSSGASQGKGGSMHIADPTIGILGTNGIVGPGLSLANGPALSAKLRGTDQVSVCFFGDGASNQGSFNEALNLAAIWDLPTVFVLENNLYGEACPVEYTHRVANISKRAEGYGMFGITIDGMDPLAVYETCKSAVARARSGVGPSLIECMTYRYYGHYEGDPDNYRTKQEVAFYRQKDPILFLRRVGVEAGEVVDQEFDECDERVKEEVREAELFARQSPDPHPEDCLLHVFGD